MFKLLFVISGKYIYIIYTLLITLYNTTPHDIIVILHTIYPATPIKHHCSICYSIVFSRKQYLLAVHIVNSTFQCSVFKYHNIHLSRKWATLMLGAFYKYTIVNNNMSQATTTHQNLFNRKIIEDGRHPFFCHNDTTKDDTQNTNITHVLRIDVCIVYCILYIYCITWKGCYQFGSNLLSAFIMLITISTTQYSVRTI